MIITKTEQEKRAEIVSRVDKSIFVEAGAGAGKTTLIVQRITNQIRQGVVKPEELVVITFTNKAAGELFERIQEAFQKEENNSDNTDEQRARFTYAIEHIEQMHISTIHSFCFSLLKERCFDAKLPLGASLLENGKNIERMKTFLDKWFAQLDTKSIEEIREAMVLFNGKAYFYKEKIEKLFFSICEKPNDVNFIAITDAELTTLKAEVQALNLSIDALESSLINEISLIAEHGKEIYERYMGVPLFPDLEGVKYKKLYKFVYDGCPAKDVEKFEDLYGDGGIQLCNKGTKAKEKETYANINKEFSQWFDLNFSNSTTFNQWKTQSELLKEKRTSYTYFVLFKYAIKARESYLKQLDNSVLSNELLIQKAKELVCNCNNVRKYFADKYKCIYVDEFQDTDHIQADLVWKLACDENDKLKDGALFVVGDPKQAIYRFRGGEPAVYAQIKNRMIDDSDANVYELDNNYRSNKEIIDWVNTQFKNPINNSGINYRDMECATQVSLENTNDKLLKGVYSLNIFENFTARSNDKRAYHEANELVDLIKKLVGGGYEIYDSKKGVVRPINYGDFLVISWDTKLMSYSIDALNANAIPVDLAGKMEINSSRILNSFFALYRYLLQPWDEKSKQGASQIICRKIEDEQRILQIADEAKTMNCYGKAWYILQHIEYILPWNVEISIEDMHLMQTRVQQMVEYVFANTQNEPENILNGFKNYISNELEYELMLEENRQAVRFMNLHKTKGLEGKITIFINRKGRKKEIIPAYTTSSVNENQQYDYYGCFSDEFTALHCYNYNEENKKVLEKAKEEDEAEKIRLEYVAATRAEEVFILSESYGNKSAFSRYEKPERDIKRLLVQPQVTETPDQGEKTDEIEKGSIREYEKVTDEAKKEVYKSLSPSDLEEHIREEVVVENIERRPKGNIFGTTMHRAFELLIKSNDDISACVACAIIENYEDLLHEGRRRYLKPEEAATVYIEVVKEYLENALDKFKNDEKMSGLINNAKEVYTEFPFSYFDTDDENQSVWISGTADLVVVDNQNFVHIIDFKSDTNKEASLEAFENTLNKKYEGQLGLYKKAMSRIFNVKLEQITTELYHLYK